MANEVPYAFPVELLSGTHDFASDTFKLALYTANPYTQSTSTVYVATSESSGTEYSAGGNTLTGNAVSNVADIATVDFTVLQSIMIPSDTLLSLKGEWYLQWRNIKFFGT